MRKKLIAIVFSISLIAPEAATAAFNATPDFSNPRILAISQKESIGEGTWVNGSGFLYSPRIVFTAGHFESLDPTIPLYASAPNQELKVGMKTVKIIKRLFPTSYNHQIYTDDFGIFILEKPLLDIDKSPLITPELLSQITKSNTPVKVMGFGVYSDVCAEQKLVAPCQSDWLNKSSLPRSIEMIPRAASTFQSDPRFTPEVSEQLFLTAQGRNGPCPGDSGGSTTLFINGIDYYIGTVPSGFWSGFTCGAGEVPATDAIGYTAPVFRFLDLISEAEKYVAEHPYIEPVQPSKSPSNSDQKYSYIKELAHQWAKASRVSDSAKKQCTSARDMGVIYKNGKKTPIGLHSAQIRSDLKTVQGFQACLNGFKK